MSVCIFCPCKKWGDLSFRCRRWITERIRRENVDDKHTQSAPAEHWLFPFSELEDNRCDTLLWPPPYTNGNESQLCTYTPFLPSLPPLRLHASGSSQRARRACPRCAAASCRLSASHTVVSACQCAFLRRPQPLLPHRGRQPGLHTRVSISSVSRFIRPGFLDAR